MAANKNIMLDDAATIEDLLKKANGKAAAHAITDAADVSDIASIVEKMLDDTGISQKARVGTRVSYIPEGPGKSYAKSGHYVITTHITLVRRTGGWRLVSAARAEIYADKKRRLDVVVTPEAADEIQRIAMKPFIVAKAAA